VCGVVQPKVGWQNVGKLGKARPPGTPRRPAAIGTESTQIRAHQGAADRR
jgi:hypothetical protein